MVDKEKIASTVQRMVDQVLEETYDEKIFAEIYYLSGYLADPADTSFRAKTLPSFEGFSLAEMKKVHIAVKKQLLKKINHKKISFLRTMRLVLALLNYEITIDSIVDFSQITNPKVKFCLEVFNLNLGINGGDIWKNLGTNQLEFVHLLDKM